MILLFSSEGEDALVSSPLRRLVQRLQRPSVEREDASSCFGVSQRQLATLMRLKRRDSLPVRRLTPCNFLVGILTNIRKINQQ